MLRRLLILSLLIAFLLEVFILWVIPPPEVHLDYRAWIAGGYLVAWIAWVGLMFIFFIACMRIERHYPMQARYFVWWLIMPETTFLVDIALLIYVYCYLCLLLGRIEESSIKAPRPGLLHRILIGLDEQAENESR